MATMREMVADLEKRLAEIHKMGGPERVEKQHARGKLTARERFAQFFDGGVFFEVGAHGTQMGLSAGDGKDKPPADAVVVGFGKVDGRMVCSAAYRRNFGCPSKTAVSCSWCMVLLPIPASPSVTT